jgi:predicted RND superfamily exporter protein
MADTPYLRLHRVFDRYSMTVLFVFGLLVGSFAFGVLSLRFDMSFRPLFASGADIEGPTLEFEETFGQSSGAWIAAILENRGMQRADFVAELASVSDAVTELAGVDEVLSISSFTLPVWYEGSLAYTSPIPDILFDADKREYLDRHLENLLQDERLTGWLVNEDGQRMLVAARLNAPMQDLATRREVVTAFEELVSSSVGPDIGLYFTGVSVVELGYEKQVLYDQLVATALTTIVLMGLLFWTFRNVAAVAICLVPVTIALIVTLGVMGWFGIPITVINTTIPAIVLAIGVADAVHMLTAWLEARTKGFDRRGAVEVMLQKTGKACLFTTVTTMGGFAALMTASLMAVGSFGLTVAAGIFAAWVANQIVLPWTLRRIDLGAAYRTSPVHHVAERLLSTIVRTATSRKWTVTGIGFVLAIVAAALIPMVDIDQRFNEELPSDHPIAISQTVFEQDFGGFLGPDISIRKRDGTNLLDDDSQAALIAFTEAIEELPDTRHVWSVHTLLTEGLSFEYRALALENMRLMPELSQRIEELTDADYTRLAVLVRVGDIGTLRAAEYREEILAAIDAHWSDDYEVEVVGQWWLAQHGMRSLLRDMTVSLATAMLFACSLPPWSPMYCRCYCRSHSWCWQASRCVSVLPSCWRSHSASSSTTQFISSFACETSSTEAVTRSNRLVPPCAVPVVQCCLQRWRSLVASSA